MTRVGRLWLTIADHTSPLAGSSGVASLALDSHRPSERYSLTGLWFRIKRMTVGVPWPGMWAPLVVDDVSQIDSREKLFDQLLAKLPFHEAVGRDLPCEAALHSE